jgi:hypothetical protein
MIIVVVMEHEYKGGTVWGTQWEVGRGKEKILGYEED